MSTIKVYKDDAANSIFIEDNNGAQFINSLQASVPSTTVTITDLARQIDIVSNADHTQFIDENDNPYTGTATEVCNQLNAIFQSSGTPTGSAPIITSSLTISLVVGQTLNYELTATYGVGYEWDLSNVPGITTVDGNPRKLIGGSALTTGTYNIPVKAINYNGEDSETIVLTVGTPTFANTKSVNFNNQDYLSANAGILQNVLGRSANGAGSTDAWTISFWYKASSDSRGQVLFYFGQGTAQGQGGYIEIRQTNNGGLKRLRLRYGSHSNYIQLNTPSGSLTPGTWQHVIITYDGGTTGSASDQVNNYYSRFKIKFDNVLQTLSGSNQNYGYSSSILPTNFRIGRLTSGNSLRNANIDELALWDSDQSANSSSIYNSGSPHDLSLLTDDPIHWWRMGDGDTYPYLSDSGSAANCTFVMNNMTSADIVSDVP